MCKESVYHKITQGKDAPKRMVGLDRREEVTINRLKTGHHPIIKDREDGNRTRDCTRCDKRAKKTLEHLLLECPATAKEREDHFQEKTLEYALLTEPKSTVRFLESTGELEHKKEEIASK
eukprot:TRINITY_DN650_c0_g1_i5.p3 TRINITY_DN650_c0_g1~~TRINITY_DN650_c0_g1_i5.p3  ORF type:complete len:120 (+),score=27.00 TRINITY_DN650_c0_g1_i5:1016-1375(+)